MCGIAGAYAYAPRAAAVDREELLRMRERMQTRGPDGEGLWIADDGRAGLAHRRLSIIDPSPAGAQPMATADGRYRITFNGEIYNYRSLRAELEAQGVRLVSHSDTEVVLQLFARHGPAMLPRLRGMFAFGLWDATERELFLARDPNGIKPLYYADDGTTARFASQVKALNAGGGVSRAPEPAGYAGFYLFGHVPEPFTLFEQVRSVPAGSVVCIAADGPGDATRYFSVARSRNASDVAGVREALLDSVRSHLVADVPVGVFLSAGIDSGSLLGLMADCGAREARAVTLAFDEYAGRPEDESVLAGVVAGAYGARHSVRRVAEDEFHADLPRLLDAMDQPTVDGVNTWFVSKAAREAGLKVALSGLGGDELFGGYPSFRDVPRWVSLLSAQARWPAIGRLLRRALDGAGGYLLPPKAAGLLEYGGSWAGAYLLRRGLFLPWELDDLLGRDFAQAGLERLQPLDHIRLVLPPEPARAFAKVAALESALYMRNQLLRDSDWAGMAHSIEVRTPLVDATLSAQLALELDLVQRQGKRLLVNAPARPLPTAVATRAKTGFTTPIQRWIGRAGVDIWRRQPRLRRPKCHWSRRWAYTVMQAFDGRGRA